MAKKAINKISIKKNVQEETKFSGIKEHLELHKSFTEWMILVSLRQLTRQKIAP